MTERLELLRIVRKICLWCQGQSWKTVCECASTGCALHAFRLAEHNVPHLLLRALKGFCLACAGSPEDVISCPASRSMGSQGPCPMHAIRTLDECSLVPCQQIRTLPGLVIEATDGEGENYREAEASLISIVAPVHSGVAALPCADFCLDHVPEALDI